MPQFEKKTLSITFFVPEYEVLGSWKWQGTYSQAHGKNLYAFLLDIHPGSTVIEKAGLSNKLNKSILFGGLVLIKKYLSRMFSIGRYLYDL